MVSTVYAPELCLDIGWINQAWAERQTHTGIVIHCCILQLEEDFVKANPEWVKELEIMVASKVKAEIQALSSFGFQYLSQVYLPLKLQEGDWI